MTSFNIRALAIALCASGSAAGAQTPAPAAADWPITAPGEILSTPNWSDYRSYPEAARRKSQEGKVVATILVGADGVPTQCRIDQSSGYGELDNGTCTLMMTMRFKPGVDGEGRPLVSTFRRSIGWLLDSPREFASSRIEAHMRVGAWCAVSSSVGPYAALWSTLACSIMKDTRYVLGDHAATPKLVIVAAGLDAGDGSPILTEPWPDGELVAHETLKFDISADGDAVNCRAIASSGFGPRGLNNLSPCGRLVSSIWFSKGATGKQGVIETRVYIAKGD